MSKPVALVVMDGIGLANASSRNAVSLAKTPNLNMLLSKYPRLQLRTDGEFVGLTKGQMGNSEVGHLNIGAGRIVEQDSTLITNALEHQEFEENKVFNESIEHAVKNNSNFHILGLISDGGVHSDIKHIIQFYKEAVNKLGNERVFIHAFLDGRDVKPKSAVKWLNRLNDIGANIASVSGRYYAMDRDQRWERTKEAYDVLTNNSTNTFEDVIEYVKNSYEFNVLDEFVKPAFNSKLNKFISNNDSVLFANFRSDRARQLTHLFVGSKLYDFKIDNPLKNLNFVTLTNYPSLDVKYLFESQKLTNTLGEILENASLNQLRAAESEKYPHVTYFFDGGVEKDFLNEKKIIIPSPSVATYNLQPEMNAKELTSRVIEEISQKEYHFIVINYANGDMVGHTGDLRAAVKAVEAVDEQIGRLYEKIVKEQDGIMLITADHGNCEEMMDIEGNVLTSHSVNPVPLIITSNNFKFKTEFRTGSTIAKLSDLTPTILKLLNVSAPTEIKGKILIE